MLLEFRELGLHCTEFFAVLCLRIVELPAQLAVFPHQVEREEGGNYPQDEEEDGNELNELRHRQWAAEC